MKELLRQRAKSYRNRANISLALIVAFIASAIYIFFSASSISNIQTQNAQIKLLQDQIKRDSISRLVQDTLYQEQIYRTQRMTDSLRVLMYRLNNSK
jgi:hypothetical protein